MTSWIQRELNLGQEEAQRLIERLEVCRTCQYLQAGACTVFPRGPEQRYQQFRHLLTGPCPWHTGQGPWSNPADLYRLCEDCQFLKPGNKCSIYAAGCDGEQRRRSTLATGHCRHYKQHIRKRLNYRGEALPASRFITTAELVADSLALAAALPVTELDGIIGVARSGVIAASVMATHYHLPLWTVSPVAKTLQPLGSGYRLGDRGTPPRGRLLIVDDTACSGGTINQVLDTVKTVVDLRDVYTAAIYATAEAAAAIDAVAHVYPKPHFLEWNFANNVFSPRLAWDFDGILCEDPRRYDTDPAYHDHLENALPLYLPRRSPVCIVSARTEPFRPQTETWLRRHGVRWHTLILWDGDPEKRWTTPDTVAAWKAKHIAELRDRGIKGYVESDPRQAAVIAELAHIPVICPTARMVFGCDSGWHFTAGT